MRFATILPRASLEAVPVAAAPDGTWIELAALLHREVPRLELALPWLTTHSAQLAARAAAYRGPRYRESEFAFLPPVVRPPAFRDFDAFAPPAKTPPASTVRPAGHDVPAFYFSNHNALVGHNAAVPPPGDCHELDYELELGVVIGTGGRDIPAERAWEHVVGLTIINDLSARDLERRETPAGLGPAKGKDFATAVGPWLVPREAFADRIEGETLTLAMSARVNGHELSRGNAAALHHPIPRLIARASRDVELFAGDLIGTGAVGTGCLRELGPETAGGWLEAGDVVELEIERIGTLRTRIAERAGGESPPVKTV
jgi:fumarylacetoacetate (FAA) hydrolase